ncbi:MAG TPA: M28 family peptidase [Gemmatimonadaceae bacterium]|nr:M28 family peptidase [Gemmatimonadaceae bacterium]
MMRTTQLSGALAVLCATLAPALLTAQGRTAPASRAADVPAAMSAIREADLRRDLFAFASDSMRGREAGTVDEMRASIWVAEQLRGTGVKPAAPDGSWFQWWNMLVTRVSTISSSASINGTPLTLWKEIVPLGANIADASGPTVWAGDGSDSTVDVRGRIAVVELTAPPAASIRTTTNTHEVRYAQAAVAMITNRMQRRGAAAIVIVADSVADIAVEPLGIIRQRGSQDVVGGAPRFAGQVAPSRDVPPQPRAVPTPAFLVRRSVGAALRNASVPAELHVRLERFETPSCNIVGIIRGTDPALRDEYVLYSSHQDHDGVRYIVGRDSVWAGADDNGSVSVAILAAARAFVKQPPKRSILIVFHGAEERGLLGSRYHAAHPVVPLTKIVAVLNGDMIGRNHPDSASLLGVQPPHRNSTQLVEMALRANDLTGKFKLDSLWDRPSHPEGWYFRSDHVPYARMNVPSIEYSTNLHADYHTPRDTPANIDYAKLTRMTRWMYLTGWFVANAAVRPAIDEGFKLER